MGKTRNYWSENGEDPLFKKAPYEGGVSPTEDGKWRWWVRTPTTRYAGERSEKRFAVSTVNYVVEALERGHEPEDHIVF